MDRNLTGRRTSIRALAADLAAGVTSARQLVEECLDIIGDPSGEGARAFILLAADRARATADGVDTIRAGGGAVPPFAGIPVAIKDLCDIEGEVTTAGSTVLADRPAAVVDAPVVARLKAAGFIPIGRTNMTEFAYSGLGLNHHYDTPRSPWDRATGRIPGGSSSGTAVAVADGMAVAGLGTDTGGSCRIPAAFCGVTGFKPTAARVPLDGIVPLSFSLDSVGPLARSVDCCAVVDDVFAGGSGLVADDGREPGRLRLGALSDLVLDEIESEVAEAYQRALSALSAGGVTVQDVAFPELVDVVHLYRQGGLAAAEAYAWHQELMAERGDEYDQRVRTRIEPGGKASAAYYVEVLQGRRRLIDVAARRLAGFDAFVLPTVPILPPAIDSFPDDDPDRYSKMNLLSLRNTMIGNFLDTCAISIPVGTPGGPPVGLMLMGSPDEDRALLEAARTVERLAGTGAQARVG
jgi:aspartyl-tRNA(Asn)/glutamyl-tRNA(Gln) amidotransferase subunit A